MTAKRFWALLLLLLAGRSAGQEEGQGLAADLVERLGHPEFEIREEATASLMALGEVARPWLEEAQGSENLEVRARAERVLWVLDARAAVEVEYREALDALAGDDSERTRLLRLYLAILRRAARGEGDPKGEFFPAGGAPGWLREGAPPAEIREFADVSRTLVIPGERLSWLKADLGPGDRLVAASVPLEVSLVAATAPELRGVFFRGSDAGEWRAAGALQGDAVTIARATAGPDYENQRYEAAAGAYSILSLANPADSVVQYECARALDAVEDYEAALLAFEQCGSLGFWGDYCLVHRYLDLRRLGRTEGARKVLENAGPPLSLDFMRRVIDYHAGTEDEETLVAWASAAGDYEAGSVWYYVGMERLLGGDAEGAAESLERCAGMAAFSYEKGFARDELAKLAASGPSRKSEVRRQQ
ncbi:MAG: hypothetical protein HY720_00825 [Planctomycetes bacterium]|nr:hypothetical protein [Planctomycetota bacterium]